MAESDDSAVDPDADIEDELKKQLKSLKKIKTRISRSINCLLVIVLLYSFSVIVTIMKGSDIVKYSKKMTHDLPDTVNPIHYDVTILPFFVNDRFIGTVNMTVAVTDGTRNIFFNSRDLVIVKVSVKDANGTGLDIDTVKTSRYEDIVNISMVQMLEIGEYSVLINFAGEILQQNTGLHQIQDHGPTPRSAVATNFGPHGARTVFPCFDSANMKATFSFNILKPRSGNYVAISIMPKCGQSEETEAGLLVHFEKSLKIPPRMTGFIITDMDFCEDLISFKNRSIPIRLFAENVNVTEFSFNIAVKLVDFYVNYFDDNYPILKLDLIALPQWQDHSTVHAGFIVFKDKNFLLNNSSSASSIECTVMEISHKMATHWVRNLRSENWGKDKWFYEGYIIYIAYKAVDSIMPEWKMMDQFLINIIGCAMLSDSTPYTSAIRDDMETNMDEQFSYKKVAGLFRMLENAVTESVFRKAFKNYFNMYGDIGPEDLIIEMQNLAGDGIDLKKFMDSWTLGSGFPIVTASKIEGGYRLTQKRFFDPVELSKKLDNPFSYKWTIPITYITDKNSEPQLVWFKRDAPFIDVLNPDADWVLFNHRQLGFYRVNYDEEDWMVLIKNIRKMTVADRSHIIEETFILADAHMISYRVPLEVAKTMNQELDCVPWFLMSKLLMRIRDNMMTSRGYSNLMIFLNNVVNNAYEHYGWDEWESDSHLNKYARAIVLEFACSIKHVGCMEESKTHLHSWLDGEIELSGNLRNVVLRCDVESNEWEKIWNKYALENVTIPEENYFHFAAHYIHHFIGITGLFESAMFKKIRHYGDLYITGVNEKLMGEFRKRYPEVGCHEQKQEQSNKLTAAKIKWLEMNEVTIEDFLDANLY